MVRSIKEKFADPVTCTQCSSSPLRPCTHIGVFNMWGVVLNEGDATHTRTVSGLRALKTDRFIITSFLYYTYL